MLSLYRLYIVSSLRQGVNKRRTNYFQIHSLNPQQLKRSFCHNNPLTLLSIFPFLKPMKMDFYPPLHEHYKMTLLVEKRIAHEFLMKFYPKEYTRSTQHYVCGRITISLFDLSYRMQILALCNIFMSFLWLLLAYLGYIKITIKNSSFQLTFERINFCLYGMSQIQLKLDSWQK